MGLSLETSVSFLTVFIQGLLSFLSPCVLPLIPLYMGYLAGGTGVVDDQGEVHYSRKTVLINTVCFVVGISFSFFLLGFGFTTLGQFFTGNQRVFTIAAGLIMCAFGLYMLGAFGRVRAVEQERRLPFDLNRFAMNPLVALLFGAAFSFAWTPCVGPILASVLLMASSSASAAMGYALIAVYTLGFILPFLAVGLFTSEVLRFFRKHGSVVHYAVKTGGVLLIVMGAMTMTGWMNGVTSYLSSFDSLSLVSEQVEDSTEDTQAQDSDGQSGSDESDDSEDSLWGTAPASDLVLVDQYGEEHTLADYQGQVVFLNFFATWCSPCQQEIPDIEALYLEYGENLGDVVVLGVANPKTFSNQSNADVTESELQDFIEEEGITYPVLFDTTGEMFSAYSVSSFPTTFMIDVDGNVFGYVPGMLTATNMTSIVEQTLAGV